MRIVRLIALALLFLSPAAGAQPPVTTLARDSEARWVAFDLTPGNQVRFGMTVNGRAATAILDTGVSYSVVSKAFATTLGLKPAASGHAIAIGGSVSLGWAAIEDLRVGGLARAGGRLAVADLTAIATGTADPVDMLIGADLIATQAVDIDYDARRFRFLPSGRMPFAGTTVPLDIARDSGVFVSEVTLGARRLRPMIVDTGDGSMVTLSHEAWGSAKLPAVTQTSAFSFGLGGSIETALMIVPAMRLAGLPLRNVELRVEPATGFSAITGTAGRIGSGLLQRYRVLMDARARRMVLAPGRTIDTPPLKSTSGLLIAYEGRALRVLHVMRGSPAAAAGWKAGERICTVDGAAVPDDYLSNRIARWPADTPGRTVALGLCDGGGARALTLADFY